jgi:hypothetical protein
MSGFVGIMTGLVIGAIVLAMVQLGASFVQGYMYLGFAAACVVVGFVVGLVGGRLL